MATQIRRTDPAKAEWAAAHNDLKAQAGAVRRSSGVATLVAGTVTVSTLDVTAGSRILVSKKVQAGGNGYLKVATRTAGIGSGSFVIVSSDNTETSSVDWVMETPVAHLDAAETARTVASADASSLATSLVLANDLMAKYLLHLADTLAHKAADAAPALTKATSLATAQTLANAIKSDYATHRASTTYHYEADALNAIAAADATDQGSLNTLLNELKADLNLHLAQAPAAHSLRLVDA